LQQVSLGHIAVDLLTTLIDPKAGVTVVDCHDDGLGACVMEGYYFPPNAYVPEGDAYRPLPVVLEVQRNWRQILEDGNLTLVFPEWLPDD